MIDSQVIIQEILNKKPSRAFSSKIEGYNLKLNEEKYPPKVRQVVNFIHDHLYNPNLDVAYIKQECRIRGNNISGIFGYHLGVTPKKYINLHRIHASKLLLSDQKLAKTKISIIAFSVGFRRPSTFTKAFRLLENIPPDQWRKEYFNK